MLKMIKRHTSLLLVVAMVLGIVCVPGILPSTTAAETTPVNLLTNPGFEIRAAIPGWNTSPNPATYAELSSDYVKDGGLSLQVTGSGKWVWSDKITGITQGTAYVMTADVLADPDADGAAIIQAIVRFYDKDDTKLSQTAAVTLDLTNTKGTWQTVTVTASAPTGAAKADVLLVTTGASVGTVFYDNVSFMKKPALTEDLTIYSENFDTMNTMSVSSSSAAVAGGWYSGDQSGVTYTVDTSSKDGSTGASLKFDKTTDAGTRTIQIAIAYPVLAGKTYRAELQYAGTVANQFYLQSYGTVNSQRKDSANVASSGIVTDGTWNKQTVTLTATQNTNYLVIVIGIGGAATGTVNFDSIKLVEVADAAGDPSIVLEDNFDDLVINSDGSPANWSVLKDSTTQLPTADYAKENTIVKSGSSLKIVKTALTTGSNSYYVTRDFPNVKLEVGKTYRMEIDYCGTLDPGAMYMMFWNTAAVGGNGTIVLQKAMSAPNADEWTHYEYEFTVAEGEAGTDAATVRMGVDVRRNSAGTMYFDNMKLVDVAAEASKEAEGNRLTNASFESSVSVAGWSNPAGTASVPYTLQSAEQAKDGSYSLKIVDKNTAGGYQFISTALDATAGEEYTATAEVYGSGSVQLVLRFLKADGKMATQVLADATATTSWTPITATGTVPEDATQVCVLVVTTSGATGTAYFDNISLTKAEEEEDTGSDENADPSVIFDETFDDTSINEKGHPALWQGHETGANLVTFTLDGSIKKGDSGYSLKMDKSHNATRTIYIEKQFEVQAGKTYRAELDYYGTVKCQFYLQTFTSGYTTVDSQNTGDAGESGKWTHLTNEIVASADADIIRVTIGLGGTTTGTVYFDNLKLVEVPEEETGDTGIFSDDFEDSTISSGRPSGWNGTADANVTYTLENNVEGLTGKTLKQVKTGSSTRSLYVDIKSHPVVAGKTYRAEMDVFVVANTTETDIGKSFQFYLQTYAEGYQSVIDTQNVGSNATEGKWVHLTNEITATADAPILRVLFGLGGSAEGTVYVDNITVVEVAEEKSDTADGNLLTNPSFEGGADVPGWTGAPADNAILSTDQKNTGSYSLKLVDETDQGGPTLTASRVEIEAGKEYTASMWVYDEAGNNGPQIYIRYRNESGTQVLYQGNSSAKTVAGQWTEITYTLEAPSDAKYAEVVVATGKAAKYTVYLDDVTLKAVEEEEDPGTGGSGTTPVDPSAIVDENFDNTSIDANGVPADWQGVVDANVTYTLDGSVKKGDSGYSLKLYKKDGTTSTRTIYIEKTFTVTAGKTYRAELDYYGAVECQFYLQTYNGSTLVDTQNAGVKGISGQWAHLTNEFVASEGAAKIRIVIGLGGSVCGTVYFDNIKLIETETQAEEEETDPNVLLQDKFNDSAIEESGLPTNWTGNTTGGEYTVEDGNIYLQMTKEEGVTTSRTIYKEWKMDIKAGQKYRLEMDYYGGPNCQFYLQLLSGGKVVQTQDKGKLGKENAWIHLTNEFVAAQDAEKIRITIGLGGSVTGTVGFDNIRLVEVTDNGDQEIYSENFETAALQASTIPKGWMGAAQADTRFKLHDTGSYVQITKDKATENPTTMVIEAPLDITAGTTYQAMIDFLGKARGAIQIDLMKGTEVIQSARKSALGNADLWGGLLAEITAENDADKVRITVSLDASAIGSYSFDNFKFVRVEPLDLENMVTQIQNPSFEVTPSEDDLWPGWSTQSEKKYFTVTDEQASDGQYSLKITDDMEEGGNNITSSRIEVIPNASYVATVDVYGDASAQIYIRFLDKYGVALSNGSASAQKEDGYWYTLKAQTTAPADAVYAVIILATTKQTTGRVYFDNVTVTVTESDSSEGGSTPNVVPDGGWNIVQSSHPRLYFTSETLKDVKAFAADESINLFGYSGAETYEDLIKMANAYLNETVYKVNFVESRLVEFDMVNLPDPNYMEELQTVPPAFGGLYYPYLSNYGSAVQLRMQTLSLAYALTGDTKYSDRAINYAMKMCEWELWAEKGYTVEGLGVNSCLETAYFVIGAATVYDMCYDQLTAAQRDTLKTNIMTKGLDMIYEDTGILVNHNYYLTRIGALITGACAIADSADEAEAYLTRGYNYAMWYLDNLYTSGDQEGFLYNSHQLEYLIESLDNLSRVTGNTELLSHEYFTDLLVDWVIYFMAPGNGKLMPISDTNFQHYFFKTMSILNKELGNEKAGFCLYYSKMSADPFETLLYTSMDPKIADAEDLYQAVTHIEKLGYGGLRSGWDADDIFLSLISNTSDMHHNHYDQNSIIFATDGNLLVSDPGYADTSGNAAGEFGDYHGHTTIFVDGKTQSVLGTGSLQTVMPSDFYGYLMGSAPDAYGEDRNGSVVDQYDRHAILINHGDRPYFVIFDELAASTERLFTWNMYTGGWNALEIEGQAIEGIKTVKGNKVAVSTSGGMLYAEFVAGEPLNISTYMHDGGGPNLQVDSGTAKETDFMTILTKNYGDSANDEYSFIPLLDDPDAVEYKTSSKDPVITKSVTVQSVPLYFFRGDKVGDYIKLPFVAKESGNFELILKTCTSYNYGIYKIYIDDKYVATYDGCAIKVELNYFSLGQMDIEAGEHILKLELVGTSSLTGGMLISAASIIFSSGQSLGSSPIYTEEVYDTEKVLGAKIFHTEYNSDIVLMNRGTGSFTAGGITSDAKQASIIGLMTDGYMEGYAATNATSMAFNGTTLLKSSSPVSVAADFRGTATFTVVTETAQTVKLYAGDGILGATVDGKSVSITTENGMAAVALSAGTHTVVLKMTQTTEIEYLDDGTIITTTYDQNGNIIRQHTQNADGTELLVENGKVIVRVYIDEDTFLLVREELAEDGTLTTTYYDVTKNIDLIVIDYPDGSRTEIDYQSDGTIVTTKWNAEGVAYEGIIQYEDGSVTKAEYKNDATVTTKYDAEGNILSTVTVYKDGGREEVIYNSDGSVVTTKYAKGGKLSSVHVLNADGSAVLKEYLSDGGVCTTTYDADGKVTDKITTYKDGSYIKDGFEHKIISGDGQNYSGEGVLIFVSNDDIVNFKYVTIDGEEIDPSWYTVEAGSIKITLTEELLSVLGSGTFTLCIVTTHGEATATFTIGAGQVSVWLWIAIAAVILAAGTTVTVILIKKKKKKEEQDEPVNA